MRPPAARPERDQQGQELKSYGQRMPSSTHSRALLNDGAVSVKRGPSPPPSLRELHAPHHLEDDELLTRTVVIADGPLARLLPRKEDDGATVRRLNSPSQGVERLNFLGRIA